MENISYQKIKKLRRIIDVDKYLSKKSNSISSIKSYYRINNLAYRLFHSPHGFMHFRISNGKVPKLSDIYYQPNKIHQYIKPNMTVLELGCGQGANLFYLAKKNKDTKFIGVDLLPLKYNKKNFLNVDFYKYNYSNLSFIEDNSIDIVYAIETIVHNSDKYTVFKEISRVLKKNGILIIYDYSLIKEIHEYPSYIQDGIKIVSKCGVSEIIQSNKEWKNLFASIGLKQLSHKDYSKEVLFDVKRLEIMAKFVMWNRFIAKFVLNIFPKLFCNNIILGWLGYVAFKEKIIQYDEWIYKK